MRILFTDVADGSKNVVTADYCGHMEDGHIMIITSAGDIYYSIDILEAKVVEDKILYPLLQDGFVDLVRYNFTYRADQDTMSALDS